jgi:ribonuclease P protein component
MLTRRTVRAGREGGGAREAGAQQSTVTEPREHAEGGSASGSASDRADGSAGKGADGSERTSARATFRRAQRLTHAREFQAVFDARMRTTAAGVGLSSGPNDLGRHRLGLSISRAVGAATVRTRLKRLIREWFRLRRHTLPRVPGAGAGDQGGGACVDWVVSLRPNCPRTLEGMSAALDALVARSIGEWTRRSRRRGTSGPPVSATPASVMKDTPRREDRAAKPGAKRGGQAGAKRGGRPGGSAG